MRQSLAAQPIRVGPGELDLLVEAAAEVVLPLLRYQTVSLVEQAAAAAVVVGAALVATERLPEAVEPAVAVVLAAQVVMELAALQSSAEGEAVLVALQTNS